jgi:tetratricopeptide (TPR) repeat protein
MKIVGPWMVLALGLLALQTAQAADSRMKAADRSFRQRRIESRARDALSLYRAIWADSAHQNVDAGWKLAMSCYFTGLRLTADDDEKEKLFREGIAAAEAASKLKPNCAACEFWAAIDQALLGQTQGAIKTLSALPKVKDHLNRVLELEPAYAYGGAYRLLGTIEEKLPGILGGDNDRARVYFEKAIAISPDEPLNYLFMAKLLADDFGDRDSARKYAERGLKLKLHDPTRVESMEALGDLRTLLAKISTERAGQAPPERLSR